MPEPPPTHELPGTPRGGCLLPILAGIAVYLVTASIGLGITIVVVRSIPLEAPNATEAYEAIGDAINAMLGFFCGLIISQTVASWMALSAALYVAGRPQGPTPKC